MPWTLSMCRGGAEKESSFLTICGGGAAKEFIVLTTRLKAKALGGSNNKNKDRIFWYTIIVKRPLTKYPMNHKSTVSPLKENCPYASSFSGLPAWNAWSQTSSLSCTHCSKTNTLSNMTSKSHMPSSKASYPPMTVSPPVHNDTTPASLAPLLLLLLLLVHPSNRKEIHPMRIEREAVVYHLLLAHLRPDGKLERYSIMSVGTQSLMFVVELWRGSGSNSSQ